MSDQEFLKISGLGTVLQNIMKEKNLPVSYAATSDFRDNHRGCDKCLHFLVLVASHNEIWDLPL